MKTFLNKYTFLIILVCILASTKITAQNEGVIHVNSSENIKQLIAKKRTYNKSIYKTKGFKIQLFYGNERAAYKVRDKFSSVFPDIPIEIRFFSPEWKVWVGAYKTQLEADRALKKIKEADFNAFVFGTEIKI